MAAALLVAACAGPSKPILESGVTAYVPMRVSVLGKPTKIRDYGYWQRYADDDEAAISARVTYRTSAERARAIVFTRLAELALENGRDRFKIVRKTEHMTCYQRRASSSIGTVYNFRTDLDSSKPADCDYLSKLGPRALWSRPHILIAVRYPPGLGPGPDTYDAAEVIARYRAELARTDFTEAEKARFAAENVCRC